MDERETFHSNQITRIVHPIRTITPPSAREFSRPIMPDNPAHHFQQVANTIVLSTHESEISPVPHA